MHLEIEKTDHITVGELVAQDFRSADVFKSFGIDFCCGGKKTLQQVCREKDVEIENIISELQGLDMQAGGPAQNYRNWEADFMCEYIINTHHAYVKEAIPLITAYLKKVATRHGATQPQLYTILHDFQQLAGEMTAHMQKEEIILFPHIKRYGEAAKNDIKIEKPPFDTILNPIKAMEDEHEGAGHLMEKIKELTNNFTPPQSACTTYKVSFSHLKQFEEDLHKHVHLENNILFPKAADLEKKVFN